MRERLQKSATRSPRRPKLIVLAFCFTLHMSFQTPPAVANDSWWSYAVPPRDSPIQAAITSESAKTLATIDMPDDDRAVQKADAIRNFVYDNSVHDIGDEFYSYWHNIPTLMVMLRQHARSSSISGNIKEKPHLECASRSALMYHLLKAIDVRARFVIVQPGISDKQTHTFLEVQNPADGSWSIQDPDAYVFWTHADGHRAGVADLLARPIRSDIVPCHAEAECGFDDYTRLIAPYFEMAVVLDSQQQDVPVLYNPARIDQRDLFFYTVQRWRYCVLFSGGCRFSVREVSSID